MQNKSLYPDREGHVALSVSSGELTVVAVKPVSPLFLSLESLFYTPEIFQAWHIHTGASLMSTP